MPYDSLDDFASGIAVPQNGEMPLPHRVLRFSGEIEVLKPLVGSNELAENVTLMDEEPLVPPPAPPAVNWFSGSYRLFAIAGSFAVAALVLGAFVINAYRSRVEPAAGGNDVATDQRREESPADPDQRTIDTSVPDAQPSDPAVEDLPAPSVVPLAIRPVPRSNSTTVRAVRSSYRSRSLVPKPRIVDSGFAPTTLVIYIEKGEIKTRIEPQLTSSYKRPATFQN